MQTQVINYFDDETMEHVATRFFVDGEEVDFEEYEEFMAELEEDEEVVETEEENCECDDCENREECELADEEEAFVELVEEVLEDILAVNGCPDCIFDILVEFGELMREVGYDDSTEEMRAFLDGE